MSDKSETPNLDKMKAATEKLLELLQNPEPGLCLWHGAVEERVHEIAAEKEDVFEDVFQDGKVLRWLLEK